MHCIQFRFLFLGQAGRTIAHIVGKLVVIQRLTQNAIQFSVFVVTRCGIIVPALHDFRRSLKLLRIKHGMQIAQTDMNGLPFFRRCLGCFRTDAKGC